MNKKIISIAVLTFSVALIITALIVYFVVKDNNTSMGAVITSTDECTKAAVDILKKGGSAVDSAITACLCTGVTAPHQSGLGGGVIATVYIRETGEFETINSREVAPLEAYKDMFDNNAESLTGGKAVAVPTELKGLFELHTKYGKLKWNELVEPVIDIAENGFKITNYLNNVFESRGDKIRSNPVLSDIYINKETNEFYRENDVVKNQRLAETLKVIAREGADAFYSRDGSFTQKIVDVVRDAGGIIKIEDLLDFKPKWGTVNESKLFNNRTIHTFPLPTSGNIINFILNILNEFKFEERDYDFHRDDKSIYHVMIEAFKFGFAKRADIGDEETDEVLKALEELESVDYAKFVTGHIDMEKTFNDFEHYFAKNAIVEDHGTSQISILASNGDAVSMTSTINYIFGSYVVSDELGIVFNNEMNDFSIPKAVSDGLLPAPANFIAPGKSPMSSMSPIIVLDDKKDVQLVLGGAGGILIMTTIVQFLVYYLYLNQSLELSMNQKRLHHQLIPMRVECEHGYNITGSDILDFLESKGHVIYESRELLAGFASLQVISRRDGNLEGLVDPRRGGTFSLIRDNIFN